ncbi:hypothetical protein LX36DRAFT_391282 [Colletotrichum falcatum]|nr:hypothetical protein LX36DRAFT_391282 [Colletotrichum falcatum]
MPYPSLSVHKDETAGAWGTVDTRHTITFGGCAALAEMRCWCCVSAFGTRCLWFLHY